MIWLDKRRRAEARGVAGSDEVASEWDAIVGSRVLYRLIGCALATR